MDGLPKDFMSGFQPSGSLGASITQGVALGWYMAAPLALNELGAGFHYSGYESSHENGGVEDEEHRRRVAFGGSGSVHPTLAAMKPPPHRTENVHRGTRFAARMGHPAGGPGALAPQRANALAGDPAVALGWDEARRWRSNMTQLLAAPKITIRGKWSLRLPHRIQSPISK
jgi:hypothetical protein